MQRSDQHIFKGDAPERKAGTPVQSDHLQRSVQRMCEAGSAAKCEAETPAGYDRLQGSDQHMFGGDTSECIVGIPAQDEFKMSSKQSMYGALRAFSFLTHSVLKIRSLKTPCGKLRAFLSARSAVDNPRIHLLLCLNML